MITAYKTILTNKLQLVNNIYLFTFKLISPLEINFIPGQYLILKVNNHPRLYSIFSSNKIRDEFKLLVGIIPNGLASTYFSNLKINGEVEFSGPLGQFILKENTNKKIFLAVGTGITPVLSILESHNLNPANYQLYWGLKNYSDVYLFDQIKKYNSKICLSREQNLDMMKEDDRKYFDLGHVDTCFEKGLQSSGYKLNDLEFYLCGGKTVVESLRLGLLAKGVPAEKIFFEKF